MLWLCGNGGNVAFMLVGGERNSVGQPLPGAFATLLVAGGVSTALTRKTANAKKINNWYNNIYATIIQR